MITFNTIQEQFLIWPHLETNWFFFVDFQYRILIEMKKTPKKLLVVGTSFGKTYLDAAKSSENWEIGGIVARTAKSIRKAGKNYKIDKDRRFQDLEEALDTLTDVDAVAITVPNALHHEFAAKVLKRGKHLILEKPIVETWEQAKDLLKLLNASKGTKAMVGQTLRGELMIRFMEHFINKEKIIGEVEQMTFESHWHWTGDPEKRWRFTLENMYLDDIGIHQFDEIRMLLNNRKCKSVMARTYNPKSYPLDINTTASAIFTFEDDILVNYFGSMSTLGNEIGWYGRTEVFGTEGSVVREASGQPMVYPKKKNKPYGLDDKYGENLDQYVDRPELVKIPYLVEDFHHAIEENRPPITDLRDNVHTFAMLLAVKLSAKERREVNVPKEFPLK